MLSRKNRKKRDQGHVEGKKLILPLALEDGRVPGLLRNMTFVTGLAIAGAVGWAASAEIRELAVASGEIAPTGALKTVHHFEGGIISSVVVEEGQAVNAGQILINLASTAATNDLSQLRSRAATLTLAKQRHTALLRQQTLNLMPPEGTDPNLVADQHQLFDAQRSLRIHEEQTLQSRIAQRESDLTVRELEIQSLARQMVISLDQLDTAEALFKKKLTARAALQTARSTHEQLVAREVAAIGRRNAARTALDEAKAVYLEAQVQAHTRHSEQLTKVSAELAELGHEIEKLTDRVDRLAVRSPVRGIIQHLPFRSAGAVIKPGEIVAKVVPSDEQLVAEVQLDPKDIGHVSLGDLAEIKVSTFDPNVFGVVPGHVARLSASSFQTERGDAYFKATIALSQNHVGQGKSQQNIRPGMTIQADIITGSKSLVKYMLKPVYRSLDSAFSER